MMLLNRIRVLAQQRVEKISKWDPKSKAIVAGSVVIIFLFKDSIFYINLTELYMDAKNLKNYFNKLHTFCYENNNSVIILTITYNTFENNQHILKIRSNVLMYMSNMIFYINKGYIEVIKNTYVFQDIIEGNLTAFIRDEKINQILS